MENVLQSQQFEKIDKFRKNGKLAPLKDEEHLSSLLNKLIKNGHLDEKLGKQLKPIGSQPAKLYGLPKVHKDGVPMRPILSMVQTAQYDIAKFLDFKLKPLISEKYACRDSFEFVNFISNYELSNKNEFMVSFDVTSLFTNVPLNETINLCCEIWKNNFLEHKNLNEVAFRELLTFATSNINFLFNNQWYKQVDGVAMGSPLAPTLASIFLSKIEENIDLFSGYKPLVYKRYVDDVFLIFENKDHVKPFLNYMNSIHSNIKFTVEEEVQSTLPFLDLLINRKSNCYETGIYRKKTDTGLYTTPGSFCETRYKSNMIKCLIYRSWSLSSTYLNAHESLNKLTSLLNKNGWSKSFIEKLTHQTLDKILNESNSNNKNLNNTIHQTISPNTNYNPLESRYILSIPYSEGFKHLKSSILKSLIPNTMNLKIISQSYKIRDMFSNKSPTPLGLCSDLVYQYTCNGCNATYIGETSRHLCKRIKEHSRLDNGSNIAEHNLKCKKKIEENDFQILCNRFKNYWERVTCEALLIRSMDPKINIQASHSTSLLNIFK